MGILQRIMGSGAKGGIDAIGGIMGKVFENKQEKLSHEEIMLRLAQRPEEAQVELNKIEAQHRSIFVAGWRPAIGWVCALGLLNTFLLNPWIEWIAEDPGPELPLEAMMTLVVSLLGLGGLRTIEKLNGRAK